MGRDMGVWLGFLSHGLLPLVFTAVHWVATLNVGSGGAHASYYHRANEQVRGWIPPPDPAGQS